MEAAGGVEIVGAARGSTEGVDCDWAAGVTGIGVSGTNNETDHSKFQSLI
jgi:hypothetical protein